MKIIHGNEVIEHDNNNVCKAFTYILNDNDISGALIKLRGRYPTKGRVVNLQCKEMAYVIKGTGKIYVESKSFSLKEGDLILINPKEKYYWNGNLTLFIPCVPAWNPDQHKEVK